MTKDFFMDLKSRIKSPIILDMMNNHYLLKYFETGNPETLIWDILAVAFIIDSSVVTEEVTLPVDVNDVYSLSYGQTLAYKSLGSEGSRKAQIILTVDSNKIYEMITKLFDSL